MRKPLHNQTIRLHLALLVALWFALAEPLACIGYYHGGAPDLLVPAKTVHIIAAHAEPAVDQQASADGALPANPICFRAAGGPARDAGAPPSPVHELLAEGGAELTTLAWPHKLVRAPEPCRPSAGAPPPTPPPRHLTNTSA